VVYGVATINGEAIKKPVPTGLSYEVDGSLKRRGRAEASSETGLWSPPRARKRKTGSIIMAEILIKIRRSEVVGSLRSIRKSISPRSAPTRVIS
jgi:hypothetical protein